MNASEFQMIMVIIVILMTLNAAVFLLLLRALVMERYKEYNKYNVKVEMKK